MLENQAFGWLKTAITRGGSENHTAIESSTDINQLISGVACDFETIKTAAASEVALAAEGAGETSAISAASQTEETSSGGGVETKESPSIEIRRQDITTRLDRIKTLLYEERSASAAAYTSRGGTPNYNWIPLVATATFKSVTATSTNLICDLITNLEILPFEARKSLAAIFNYMCVCGMDGVDSQQFTSVSQAFGGYIFQRAHMILGALVKGHECKSVDVILLCGAMLRSCLRHVTLYRWILADPQCVTLVYPFLERCVHDPNFDVSSDALETVRVMLTGSVSQHDGGAEVTSEEEQYKQALDGIASEFLTRKYDDVVDQRINQCLTPQSNYMTRRMTLQLLSTILLNRSNYNVMIRYISSSPNLVTILNLLRDPSPHITLDAFQVFKIFVANPSKPPEVIKILYDNKVKLVKYLEGLHKEREKSDEQFRDEKGLVVGTLEDLELVER